MNNGDLVYKTGVTPFPFYIPTRSFEGKNANIIDTTNCIWVDTTGTYYVTVTDSNGCTATDSVYVDITPCITGCTDSLAFNYNASATIDDGSCLYCNLTLNLPDTLTGCDSVEICANSIAGGSYSWSNNNSIVINQNYQRTQIQLLLDNGHTVKDLLAAGVSVDSLYALYYQGGYIFCLPH